MIKIATFILMVLLLFVIIFNIFYASKPSVTYATDSQNSSLFASDVVSENVEISEILNAESAD